mmetsp:Transcript_65066/g.136300  ORF Transcript_65066/g.136300 Transcript_65066/m.136300 type:complete len:997 (+) Transcript_65066:207-3197(+)
MTVAAAHGQSSSSRPPRRVPSSSSVALASASVEPPPGVAAATAASPYRLRSRSPSPCFLVVFFLVLISCLVARADADRERRIAAVGHHVQNGHIASVIALDDDLGRKGEQRAQPAPAPAPDPAQEVATPATATATETTAGTAEASQGEEAATSTSQEPLSTTFSLKTSKPQWAKVGWKWLLMMGAVISWFGLLFFMGAVGINEESKERRKDGFFDFEKKSTAELFESVSMDRWTLKFEDKTQETRFIEVRGALLNQRAVILAVVVIIYLFWHSCFTFDHSGHPKPMPVLSAWSKNSAALTYLSGVACCFLMSAMLIACGQSKRFSENFYLEKLVIAWVWLQALILGSACSQWFVCRMFDTQATNLFGHVDAMGEEISWQFLVLYSTTILPVRFVVCSPLCAGLPLCFSVLIMRYGSPTQEALKTCGAHEEAVSWLLYMIEATSGLFFISGFALVGKYFNERQERIAFVSKLNAFNTIQELQGDEEDNTGSAPAEKVRCALNSASTSLEIAGARCRDDAILKAKTQVDYALRLLRNVSNFFDVDEEDLLKGMSIEGDADEYAAYLTQNEGKQLAMKDEPSSLAKPQSLKLKLLKSVHSMRDKHFDNGFPVKDAVEVSAGWGESWTFSAAAVGRSSGNTAMLFAGEHAFLGTGALAVLGVQEDCIRTWVRELHCRYTFVPYHNEAHGAQVAHFSYWFAKQTGLLDHAQPFQMCALLIAAFAHDVGHFARTSMFLSKTSHAVALIWNEASVLENMHTSICFALMSGKSDILKNMPASQRTQIRVAVTRYILATDVKLHASAMSKLKAMMDDKTFLSNVDNEEAERQEEEIIVAGEFIMRTADIAHCMLPWEHHKEWSYRVQIEFFEQGDFERSLGLPISPLCERETCNIAGGQAFFIDHFGVGLMTVLKDFGKRLVGGNNDALQECIDIGLKNKDKWKEEAKSFDALSLSMKTVEELWGAAVKEVVYPYSIEKAAALAPQVCEQNLRMLADFKSPIIGG